MPRPPRIVIPGLAHHVIHRGTRRQRVFFQDADRQDYLRILRARTLARDVKVWAWCLMDNHVHLLLVPPDKTALAKAVGESHQEYALKINKREGWNGYLWQGRFLSFPVENSHLARILRYVECNPVRAGIVRQAEDFPWSSARAHTHNAWDPILSPCPLELKAVDWGTFLKAPEEAEINALRQHLKHGKLWGDKKCTAPLLKPEQVEERCTALFSYLRNRPDKRGSVSRMCTSSSVLSASDKIV